MAGSPAHDGRIGRPSEPSGRRTAASEAAQGDERGTYAALERLPTGKAGSPSGREPQGDGAPVVVRGRESRPHGEGGQVTPMPRVGGYARCGAPKPSWASSATVAVEVCRWRTSIVSCSTPPCSSRPTTRSTATRGP